MTDAPALKPCPFCRGIARIGGEALYVSVRCSKCSATVGWVLKPGEEADAVISAWNTRADLIDMDVLLRVEAGYSKALTEAESWIHDQLDGTGHVEDALADLDESRSALTGLRAMMEKLK